MTGLIQPTLQQVLDFCMEDPVERVFIEDVARRGLGRFLATPHGDGIDSLCHVGLNVVPSGEHSALFATAVVESDPRMIIGEQSAVDRLWERVESRLPSPRQDRPFEPVFELRQPPAPGESGLRAATLADLDLLVPVCARAHEEELGIDPLERDASTFRWRTRAQIELGRSWLWVEEGHILFKAEASAWTTSAVQLQQVWTDPEVRRQGFATRGMHDLLRLLLARTPCVCLFVRPENEAAIRLYETLGMQRVGHMRSIVL
jgi:ribosomal protein S18 acetylase RimI-like enzyme